MISDEAYIRDCLHRGQDMKFHSDTVRELVAEIDRLRSLVDAMATRIASQSELLSKVAERNETTSPVTTPSGDIGGWYDIGDEE